ncbi:MAG TPA: hypothetical protein VLM79_20855, partial [Kofleriaceae bacterium]|nr:hypothetical protein [Kofleriaceae bacterium]
MAVGGAGPSATGARGISAAAGVRGTPAYLAPEALVGDSDPRSDLYGLGATAVRLATGHPLFEAATLGDLLQRVLAGGPPPELPALPRPLADLIGRMVARDPDARPRSALAVLDELDQLAAAIAPDSPRRARPRVGPAPAPIAWPGAATVIDAIARSLAGSAAAVLVIGTRASGARELVDGAIRRHQLANVARSTLGGALDASRPAGALDANRPAGALDTSAISPPIAGSLDDVGAAFAVIASAASGAASSARAWLEHVARAARRYSAPVVIELGDDPRAAALIGALVRAGGGNPVVAIVDRDPEEADEPRVRPGVAVHVAPTLDSSGVAALAAAMIGTAPPRAWAHALWVASSGLALAVIELLRSIANEPNPFAVDWTARTTAGIAELRARQLRAAPAGARRVAAATAAWGGRVRIDRALATVRAESKQPAALADIAELERLGLAQRRGDEITIDRATADAAAIVLGGEAIARLATAGLAWSAGSSSAGSSSAGSSSAGSSSTGSSSAGSAGAGSANAVGSPKIAAGERDGLVDLLRLAPLLERAVLDGERAQLACDAAE